MRGPLWEGLLKNHEPRLKPPYSTSCFGELIGSLDSGEDCWEVSGDLRDLYYTAIHPKLCERLFAIFGTASIADWITLPVYMVGQRHTNALPTVMVCSEDESARKKARKEIKKSAFLKEHARFKVMSVPADPGMRNMEQLASDANGGKTMYSVKRATKVLVDSTKPLQAFGMEVWVDHGSSLRPTTAFVAQIHGRTFLRTVDHAFVTTASSVKANITTLDAMIPIDSDSESESESEDEDDHDVAITSIGSQSPDTWSDTSSDSGTSSASTVFSGKSTPTIDDIENVNNKAVPLDVREISSKLAPLVSFPTTYSPKQIVQPLENTLVSLGRLALWSVDKDWALIEITNEELILALERSTTEAAPPVRSLPGPKDNAEIVSYTSSGGMLTGTFSGTPFCTRLPNSSSFQDVHRVRLNGALANGDCGSAVRNAATGELYGHIVAGCRTTGTAFIMAAHQIEADFADLKMEGPFGPRQTPNEVQTLMAHTADTKSENQQDSVDQIQLTDTESVVNSVRYGVAAVPSALKDRVTPSPEREALETPDCHDQRYHFSVASLCWTLELFSAAPPLFLLGFEVFILLLPLLVLFKMFIYDAKTVSLNTALTPYLPLLVWYSSGHLSLRLAEKIDATFALRKIILLTATCYIGCVAYTDLVPEADSSRWSLPADNLVCPATHLRPDPGGALMPWLYTLFLLLLHLPAYIIRAVRWESAQYLALGLASFNIAVTVQSYVSTKLDPAEVLAWMPLTLMLDIGAMQQMVILILEMEDHSVGKLTRALGEQIRRIARAIVDGFHRSRVVAGHPQPRADRPTLVKHALVALFATLFGTILLVLQIYGLAAARRGLKTRGLTVKWCSPSFRDFALIVTTGNCERYSVIESSSNGIGCIRLPASQQEGWLKGTVVAFYVLLLFDTIDLLLVRFAGRTNEGCNREVRGTRLRRPWLSMFGGALTLIILIYYGANYANDLPPGVTDVVWIYRKETYG